MLAGPRTDETDRRSLLLVVVFLSHSAHSRVEEAFTSRTSTLYIGHIVCTSVVSIATTTASGNTRETKDGGP